MIMSHSTGFYDLQEALAQPDCAVCRLKGMATERYLDRLLWESVNDPGLRHDIRHAQGFCREHAWAMVSPGAALGVAIISHDVLKGLIGTLENARFGPLPALSLRRIREGLRRDEPAAATAELVARLVPQAECLACIHAREMEEGWVSTLVEHLLGEGGLLAAYEASAGLCLPHFRQALARVRDEAVFKALVDAQRRIWERLAGQLSERIRKSDFRFRDESWGEESDAWQRAVKAFRKEGKNKEAGKVEKKINNGKQQEKAKQDK